MRRPRLLRHLFIASLVLLLSLSLATHQSPAQTDNPPTSNCKIQPYGMISQSMANGFNNYWPLYVEIAKRTSVDPILIAPLHYREHFGLDNPANNQGIFQQYSLVRSGRESFPSTHKQPVSIEEFIRQGVLAINHLKSKVPSNIDTNPPDDVVQNAYWGYNGRTRRYNFQVRPGQPRFDGSPYVMNEPGIRNLKMVTHDGGGGRLRTDTRPGAWPIYRDLKAVCWPPPASTDTTVPVTLAEELIPPATSTPPQSSVPVEDPPIVEAQAVKIPLLPTISPKEADMNQSFGKSDWSPELIDVSFSQSQLWLAIAGVSLMMAMTLMFIHRRAHQPRDKTDPFEPTDQINISWKWIGLATVFSAGMALVGDYVDDGWRADQVWRNIGLMTAETLKWGFYGPRVKAIFIFMMGGLAFSLFALIVEREKAGKQAVRILIKSWLSAGLNIIKLTGSVAWASRSAVIPLLISSALVLVGQHQAKTASAIYITLVVAVIGLSVYTNRQMAMVASQSDSTTKPKPASKSTSRSRSTEKPKTTPTTRQGPKQ